MWPVRSLNCHICDPCDKRKPLATSEDARAEDSLREGDADGVDCDRCIISCGQHRGDKQEHYRYCIIMIILYYDCALL